MIKGFNGKTPRIASTAFVSVAAYIVGDVEIGENAGVWPGAVVRGDVAPIKIGRNSNVEDNSVLHGALPMEIGENVILGHGVIMHGVRVGSNTLVGNNATILDDAEIGSYCIIGAGCVINTKAKIPDHSFVAGVPGRIKGQSSPEQLKWITQGVPIYLKLAQQYKEQGL